MSSEKLISIVVPAYNEERRLGESLRRIEEFLASRRDLVPAEIVVVDDGSVDATVQVANTSVPPAGVTLRVLSLPKNRGKGAAVRTGMAASEGRKVLISDADLATPIEEVDTLLAAGVDFAAGSRAVRRELIVEHQPFVRELGGRVINLAFRMLGLTSMSDTQCGFKLINGELARRLAAEMRLDGFAFDVELLARARRHGASLAEVPVRWYHVDDSRVRPLRHGLQVLRDALRVRFWLWMGR